MAVRGAAGVVGGGGGYTPASSMSSAASQAVANTPSALDTLLKIGGEVLTPHLKELQVENFNKGMQMVQNGLTMEDVKQNQPAFLKVLGNSDVVAGARAYSSSEQSSMFRHELMRDMAELRQLSPDDYRREVVRRQQGMLTGDAQADTIIQQGFLEFAPQMYDVHLREHLKYSQEVMQKSWGGGLDNTVDAYKSFLGSADYATSSDEIKMQAKSQLLNSVMRQQEFGDWYEPELMGKVEARALNGDMTLASVMYESGYVRNLSEESQIKIAKLVASSSSTLMALNPDLAIQLNSIHNEVKAGNKSEAEGAKEAIAINNALLERSGATGLPIFDVKSVTQIQDAAFSYDQKQVERAERKADALEAARYKQALEDATAQREVTQAAMSFARGDGAGGHDPKVFNSAAYAQLTGSNPATGERYKFSNDRHLNERSQMLVNHYRDNGYVQPDIQGELSRFERDGFEAAMPDDFVPTYNSFLSIKKQRGGMAAAVAYFGQKTVNVMNDYERRVNINKEKPASAYIGARLMYDRVPEQELKVGKEDMAANRSQIKESLQPSWLGRKMGSGIPSDAVVDQVSQMVQFVKQNDTQLVRIADTEARTKAATEKVLADSVLTEKVALFGSGAKASLVGVADLHGNKSTERDAKAALDSITKEMYGDKVKSARMTYQNGIFYFENVVYDDGNPSTEVKYVHLDKVKQHLRDAQNKRYHSPEQRRQDIKMSPVQLQRRDGTTINVAPFK